MTRQRTSGPNGTGTIPSISSSREIWAYDSRKNTWTEVHSANQQVPGIGYALYDPSIRRFVVIDVAKDSQGHLLLGGIWAYDPLTNAGSTVESGAPAAPALEGQSIVLSPPSGQLLAYGGDNMVERAMGEVEPLAYSRDFWAWSPNP